jgi:hypothetical protein
MNREMIVRTTATSRPKSEFRQTVTPWASGLAINIRLANVLLPGDLAVWAATSR